MLWKNTAFKVPFPTQDGRVVWEDVCGRDILKNVGEYIKIVAGYEFWATWTSRDILIKFWQLPDILDRRCDIAFGSVRFKEEAEAVFQVAKTVGKDVQFIFCNYNDTLYQEEVHVSEKLAHHLIAEGCSHGDDVTDMIRKYYKI